MRSLLNILTVSLSVWSHGCHTPSSDELLDAFRSSCAAVLLKQLEIGQDLSGGCELQFWSHHETWNPNKINFGGVRLPGAQRLDLMPAPGIRAGKNREVPALGKQRGLF